MELSSSLIKVYKTCRRKYELRYVEELEPIAKSQALTDGSNYHECIEKFYKTLKNAGLDTESMINALKGACK